MILGLRRVLGGDFDWRDFDWRLILIGGDFETRK